MEQLKVEHTIWIERRLPTMQIGFPLQQNHNQVLY